MNTLSMKGSFRDLLEAAPDALVVVNLQGRIILVNVQTEKLFGYQRGELINCPLDILVPKRFRKVHHGHCEGFFAHPRTRPMGAATELAGLRKDGSEFPADITLSPIETEDGLVVISAVRDITERKKAEETGRRNVELERQVQERNAELARAKKELEVITERERAAETLRKTEAQLRQAQKLEAVARLSGGVAHDFNNLLSVIIGYSELLLDSISPESRMRNQCAEIKKAAERAASLTRQLLAFSRQQAQEPVVLDLNAIVVDIQKMLERLIGEDIDLQISLDPALGRVKADPGQVQQVIMNLAVNARDAMPDGGKLVIETGNAVVDRHSILHHPTVSAGSYVVLTVTDTGIGMDPETRTHIFEPFYTTKEPGKGTGLGLSTVYGIVRQSGGSVWVNSAPGQGAVFQIYLPRVHDSVQAIRPVQEAPGLLRGTETVLVVEDEQSVRTLTREILEKSGYAVLEADKASHALEIAQRHVDPIHLLLTDVVMPGMTGPTLAQHLAAIHPEMKVVYVSGYGGEVGAQCGLLPVGAILLRKPVSRTTLLRQLREVLEPSLTR